MPKPPPLAETVLQIFVDRFLGVQQADTAKTLNLHVKTISSIVKKYRLDEIESQLRFSMGVPLTPEAVSEINASYDKLLNQALDLQKKIMQALADELKKMEDSQQKVDTTTLLNQLNTLILSLERTRNAQISIANVKTELKESTEQHNADEFDDLVDDV